MNGVPAESHLGRSLRDVLGEVASKLEPALQRVLVTGEPALNIEFTGVLPARNEVGHWIVNYFPIKNAAGQVKRVGAVVVEITKQKKLEDTLSSLGGRLQQERDRLHALLEGAISQKIGRLELADQGTLFLDEVGDIPLELQPKLLRVLQDHEFERLGSTHTLRVNIRLIAATNRDLAKAVAERDFRSDLYYRLNVFPIRIPPLRERRDDIPLLVRYFVQKFARKMNKQVDTIPSETMNSLVGWEWPGNVRELENFMERSVILSDGAVLRAPLAELSTSESGSPVTDTLVDLERQHIIRVLRETGGVIAGSHGAASRLGMKRTTLQSRIIKMKISREEYEH